MKRKHAALAVVASGLASFLVLVAGVAMFSVPLALVIFGGGGVAVSLAALIYDPERSAP